MKKQTTILIVDDNPSILYSVRRGLESLNKNLKVYEANSGKKALNFLEKKKPDLILLDLMMPRVDGWDIFTKLKSRDETRRIPIMLLTALESDKNNIIKPFDKLVRGSKDIKKLKHIKVRKDNYIKKPFSIEELDRKIGRYTKKR